MSINFSSKRRFPLRTLFQAKMSETTAHGFTTGSLAWYVGSKSRSLLEARAWRFVINTKMGVRHNFLTPQEVWQIRQIVHRFVGPDFHCSVMINRNNAAILRVEIKLDRAVTASQEVLDEFYKRAEHLNDEAMILLNRATRASQEMLVEMNDERNAVLDAAAPTPDWALIPPAGWT